RHGRRSSRARPRASRPRRIGIGVGPDRPRTSALRPARADVRPRGRGSLAGPGPALAPLSRLAAPARSRARPRRRDGNPARGRGAAELRRGGFSVTGLDQSEGMLDMARAPLGTEAELVASSAEDLPFADGTFDHLTFTYLLRYVDDPGAVLGELARVVRPGGT